MILPLHKDILIAYGSQTGQSQTIAELIAEKLQIEGIESRLDCLNNVDKKVSILHVLFQYLF